jgi:hypothetical protein
MFLACAVDRGLLPALSSLASQQANPTEKTMELCKQFLLDYLAMQEDAILPYRASNMVLAIHSDTSYLSEPKSHSRAGGHMFMAGKDNISFNYGAILNILQKNSSSHVICSRGRIECTVYQCQNSCLDAPNARGTQPPTTTHTNAS